jgi:tRNA 5-methylaminomethyl-2-thiouridine biosynthesis bifunctional protein
VRARLHDERLSSRAALRAGLPDFAPVAGLLPEAEAWTARFSGVSKGQKPDLSSPPPTLDGLYVLGGLGARGLTMAPLLGERIAAEMFGEPQALSWPALDAVHPARFLHRALKRGG